jgi:hypothetical protein
MSGAIHPLPQYAFMAWCLVKAQGQLYLYLTLYRCETWSLTLKEKHRLRVFENRVLSRIFGPKCEEVARNLRRLHKEVFHNVYVSQNNIRVIKFRRMRWAGHVASMGEMRMHTEFWSKNLRGRDH